MVVCVGSGGVGKTTMSAALAVRGAHLGRRVLVLTVDPARRLATALGLDEATPTESGIEHTVPLVKPKGSLRAAVIDSKKVFDEFIRKHSKEASVVERIMRNRLYQQMSTTLSGSQEFTALERLLQGAESDQFDLVILDTPPTKHAMDFLSAPQRIQDLFQDAITKWFMGSEEKPKGLFANIVGRGPKTVLKSLEVLTGGQFIEELVDFFTAVRSIQVVLRERSAAAAELLNDPKTAFIVVTSFDAAKLLEAKQLGMNLRSRNYSLQGVIINRAFPLWLPETVESGKAGDESRAKVLKFFEEFRKYYAVRYNLYEEFEKSLGGAAKVVRVPEYREDVHGLSDLVDLANVLGQEG
ncbi:MAG: ArsA-related P-loop ATPase [Bdellovibrionota bacterium]